MSLRNSIIERFDGIGELPVFPETIQKVIDTIKDPESSVSDITNLIKYEPSCSVSILKVANSAFYNPSGNSISNVTQAISRLGLNELNKICMACGASRMFIKSSKLIDLKEFWKHNISVAMGTRAIVSLTKNDKEAADNAFTAGLLHDVGIMILDQFFPLEYEKVRNISRNGEKSVYQCELELLGVSHAEIGSMLLKKWGMPAYLYEIVANHHEPDKCPESVRRICQIVSLTDFAVSSHGILEPGERMPEMFSHGAWFDLGLEVDDIYKIIEDIKKSAECAKLYTSLGIK